MQPKHKGNSKLTPLPLAYRDVLHCTTTNLPTPNLPFIAKNEESYENELCILVGLILAIVVKVRSLLLSGYRSLIRSTV